MKNKVTKFKCFWGWQDEQEENWLMEQARQGYHLIKANPGVYTFKPGPAVEYVYRLDYQDKGKRQLQAYLQLFSDSGWELVCEMGGWHYFRRPVVSGEKPEIYTDPASKAEKYRRLMVFSLSMLPLLVVSMKTVSERIEGSVFWLVFEIGLIVLTILYVVIIIRLYLRYKALKQQRLI